MSIEELHERIRRAPEHDYFWLYVAMIDLTETFCEAMDAKGISYAALSRVTGIKKRRLRRFFGCSEDMRLQEVVKIAWALGLIPIIDFRSKDVTINDRL